LCFDNIFKNQADLKIYDDIDFNCDNINLIFENYYAVGYGSAFDTENNKTFVVRIFLTKQKDNSNVNKAESSSSSPSPTSSSINKSAIITTTTTSKQWISTVLSTPQLTTATTIHSSTTTPLRTINMPINTIITTSISNDYYTTSNYGDNFVQLPPNIFGNTVLGNEFYRNFENFNKIFSDNKFFQMKNFKRNKN
jgi:hypothetical protein